MAERFAWSSQVSDEQASQATAFRARLRAHLDAGHPVVIVTGAEASLARELWRVLSGQASDADLVMVQESEELKP